MTKEKPIDFIKISEELRNVRKDLADLQFRDDAAKAAKYPPYSPPKEKVNKYNIFDYILLIIFIIFFIYGVYSANKLFL